MDILLRVGLALVIVIAGVAAYRFWTRVRVHTLVRQVRHQRFTGLELRAGVPAILYFTTPTCTPCKTIQGPVIEELHAQYGEDLQIIRVNAEERPDLADYWGVLGVPTTFILDARGEPRHVNNGVTSAARLRQQLREFAGLESPIGDSPARVVTARRAFDLK